MCELSVECLVLIWLVVSVVLFMVEMVVGVGVLVCVVVVGSVVGKISVLVMSGVMKYDFFMMNL